ncbi:MAG TPA: hypothetical protein VFK97_02955 [Candidatus Saccharimonadales bacterium]|nr:hypothetical protein [Candidatus Saccharimonadales bacterium]
MVKYIIVGALFVGWILALEGIRRGMLRLQAEKAWGWQRDHAAGHLTLMMVLIAGVTGFSFFTGHFTRELAIWQEVLANIGIIGATGVYLFWRFLPAYGGPPLVDYIRHALQRCHA